MTKILMPQRAILAGLRELHYRRIVGGAALDEVGRLRSTAFDAKDIYTEKFGNSVIEDYDFAPNAHVFGLYRADDLIATLRVNVACRDCPNTPAVDTFPNELRPMIDQGFRFVDPGRLAVDPKLVDTLPALPMYMLRTASIVTLKLNVENCLAVVREHHEKFYRSVLRAVRIAGPKNPGNTFAKLSLISMSAAHTALIQSRYPVFNFLDSEAQQLTDLVPSERDTSDPIWPTAAEASGIDQNESDDAALTSVA
ncbi:MAG: DUF1685 domain-containing protein [Pseudomonadota bacterium]